MSQNENTATLDTTESQATTTESQATTTESQATIPSLVNGAPIPLTKPEGTGAERRAAMRAKASERHAALVNGTRKLAAEDKATRKAELFEGREGYVEWTALQRDNVRDSLDGTLVTLTLLRLSATKRGNRVTVTGVAHAAGHVVAIKGEATIMDVADARTLDGAQVTVCLTARRGETPNGTPFTGFQGESVGLASTGQRIGLRCRVTASRYARVAASTL